MKKVTGILLMLAGIFLLTCAGALTFLNMQRQEEAGTEAANILMTFREKSETQQEEISVVPEKIVPEQMRTMSTVEIDGVIYIGAIQIPSLELQLPVIRDWNSNNLQISPCLYSGSVYSDDMVLCAHNYSTHFGRLQELHIGDAVEFYTADGKLFRYTVGEVETLAPTDVEDMTNGEWPLTLFTCTWGGQSRVTVRCETA